MMTKTSFDLYDYWQTVNTFSHIYEDDKPRFDALMMRMRKAELCALLHRVIRNELNEQDRLLIRMHWYQGKTAEEIAAILELDRSSVYRRIERITNTLFEKLKYAVSYRYDNDFSQSAAKLMQKDLCTELQARENEPATLRKYRKGMFLTKEELASLLGLSASRIAELERDTACMTVGELRKFTALFGVSADTLLFGSTERG